jgi:hypothetical protein
LKKAGRVTGFLAETLMSYRSGLLTLLVVAAAMTVPGLSLACACGCGIFDVGTSSMYASHAGGMAFLEYDYLDQSHNRSGTERAPPEDNDDKQIRSTFMTVGGQYQFSRSWGVAVEVPYWNRYLKTTDVTSGALVEFTNSAVGDIRIKASYTGFSADMSSGLTFGVKLANGDSDHPGFDADTQIGSGSTDLLLGGYHLGRLSSDNRWTYFLQAQWDQPVLHEAEYRPGAEAVAVAGAYFEGWSTHSEFKLSPVVQLRVAYRAADSGAAADPENSGYSRVLVSPGVEMAFRQARIYADVALPLYTNARGNQLFANEMWKVNASYYF